MVAQVQITTATDRDFFQVFQYTLPDKVTPISLLGASFRMSLRRTAQDAGVMCTITETENTSGQVIPVDAPSGIFAVWLKQAQMAKLPAGVYVHSLVATTLPVDAQPTITQAIWDGALTLNPGPSR